MSKLEHAGASTTVAARLRQRERRARRHPPSIPRARHRHHGRQAPARPAARASPIATTSPARSTQRRGQLTEVAALVAAADDRDQAGVHALDRPPRRLDVGRLRVVDEPHAVDRRRPISIACSRPVNAGDRRVIACRRRAGGPADRRRGHHVAQDVPARHVHRIDRHERRHVPAAPLDDHAVVDAEAVASKRQPVVDAPRLRAGRQRLRAAGRRRSPPPSPSRPGCGRFAPSPPRTPRSTGAGRGDRARSSAAPQSTGGTCRSPPAGSCSPRRRAACPCVESST